MTPARKLVAVLAVAVLAAGLALVPAPAFVVQVAEAQSTPTVTLEVSPNAISEDADLSFVTASLDRSSTADITVTVSVAFGDGVHVSIIGGELSNKLRIRAGDTTTSDLVILISTDNDVYTGDREVVVSGAVQSAGAVNGPEDVTLTVTDDELEFVSAVVNYDSLVLTYGEALDDSTAPSVAAFAVSVAGAATDPTVDAVTVTGKEVRLDLSRTVAVSDTVTVTYDRDRASRSGGSAVRSARSRSVLAGNLTDHAVNNDTGSDVSLSSLTLTAGERPVGLWQTSDLSQAFSPAATSYAAAVYNFESEVTVTAVAADSDIGAAVVVSPDDEDNNVGNGHQVGLSEGSTQITVTVTSANGTSTGTYTVAVSRVAAGIRVPADWPFVPDSFEHGHQFRLLAVTSNDENAVSTDIADYDVLVQEDVRQRGHHAARPVSSVFKILGCTAEVAARDHTGTNPVDDGLGVPVYWLNGEQVSGHYADLFDGDWDPSRGSDRHEARFTSGIAVSTGTEADLMRIWTGCEPDGTPQAGNELGADTVRRGRATTVGEEFVQPDLEPAANTQQEHLYAMSSVFEVDTDLSFDLTVAGSDGSNRLHGFTQTHPMHHAGFHHGEDQATITWTADTGGDDVTVSVLADDGTVIEDADPTAEATGHQVDLDVGLNKVRVQVRSSDTPPKFVGWDFTLNLGRSSLDLGGWRAGDDINYLWSIDNIKPRGVWGTDSYLWVADDGPETGKKVLAFDRSSGSRLPSLDIVLSGGNQYLWGGVFSDAVEKADKSASGTLWVGDTRAKVLYAYTVSVTAAGGNGSGHGDANPANNIDLVDSNGHAVGMWSDGTTMWVGDYRDDKLYAYSLESDPYGEPDPDKDIAATDAVGFDRGDEVRGLASDGTVVWVFNDADKRLYAFRLSDRTPVARWNFPLASDHADRGKQIGNVIRHAWYDNDVIYVPLGDGADYSKVYAYNTSRALPLSSATVADDTLTLTYILKLDTDSVPNTSAFTVSVVDAATGSPRATTVTAVSISGHSVLLTLAPAVGSGDTVSVTYNSGNAGTGLGVGPIEDETGTQADDLTDKTVNNITPKSIATLERLALTHGDPSVSVTLTPRFAPEVKEYDGGNLDGSVSHVTVIATATTDSNATVNIEPTDADGLSNGHQVDLSLGENTITVTVTAEDGDTTTTYTVDILLRNGVSPAWILTPPDFETGDRFRLMGRTTVNTEGQATDGDISNLDGRVRTDVSSYGHEAIQDHSSLFTAACMHRGRRCTHPHRHHRRGCANLLRRRRESR